MNLITIILVVSLFFALTDFINFKDKRISNLFFKISFLSVTILSTIKYFYGPDVLTYFDMYNSIETSREVFLGKSAYAGYYEVGFLLLLSIFKSFNISFYLLTAVISLFYFYSLSRLFNFLPSKKSLALCLLLVLDNKLVMVQFRQCIAVSFFILLILAYINRKYIKCFLFATLMIVFHKSSLIIVMLLVFTIFFKDILINKKNISFLLVLLIIMMLTPLDSVLLFVTDKLNLSGHETVKSIIHHIKLSSLAPLMLLLYFISYFAFIEYKISDDFKTREYKTILIMVFVALLIIAVFFKYYYLLNRLRSYILPFLIIGTIIQLDFKQPEKKTKKLYNTLIGIYVLLFSFYSIVQSHKASSQLKGNIYESCTIFSLIDNDVNKVRNQRIDKIDKYWKFDRKSELLQN